MSEWLGHHDLCASAWSDFCDCDDGPLVTAPAGSVTTQCADREWHGPHGVTFSKDDPRTSWWCPGIDNQ